jgi:hypothetical protein
MIYISYFGFWLFISIFFISPSGGASMLQSMIALTTLVFLVSTILCSSLFSLSVTFSESIKSSMLSTVFIGIGLIFFIQVVAKNSPALGFFVFIPLILFATYLAIKTASSASTPSAIIIVIFNFTALSLVSKAAGFALSSLNA